MRYLKALIIGLFVCLTPYIVRADSGGPMLTSYDVIVTNVEGADLVDINYDGNKSTIKIKKHLDYDTIIKEIYSEEYINNELYGYSGKESAYVKLSDVKIYGNYNLSDFDNYGKGKIYVYKEGAYLYKGPSVIYGKVDGEVMIPIGEELDYQYRDDLFAYVTYNGVSGWIIIDTMYASPYEDEVSALVSTKDKGELYTIEDTYLYTLPEHGEKKEVFIPKGTIVNFQYRYYYNKAYYVEYNGTSGWIIDKVGIMENNLKLFTHLKSVDICEKAESKCTKVVGKISKNKIVPIEYGVYKDGTWYYVKYNDIKGYVYLEYYYEGSVETSYETKYELKKDAKLYSDIYGSETDMTIDAGEINIDFNVFDNGDYTKDIVWLHIYDGKNIGWIKVNNSEIEMVDPIEEEPVNEEPGSPNSKNKDINITLSFNDILIYSVLGAVALSITIIVIIKLVNKKKEVKLEEVKKEETENKE